MVNPAMDKSIHSLSMGPYGKTAMNTLGGDNRSRREEQAGEEPSGSSTRLATAIIAEVFNFSCPISPRFDIRRTLMSSSRLRGPDGPLRFRSLRPLMSPSPPRGFNEPLGFRLEVFNFSCFISCEIQQIEEF